MRYHAIWPARQAAAKELYDVVGPVCETGDTFHINEKLPVLKAGDVVALMTSGAYGAVMSSNYNTRPLAPEVLVSGKKSALVRKPQTVQDLLKHDLIPEWLD